MQTIRTTFFTLIILTCLSIPAQSIAPWYALDSSFWCNSADDCFDLMGRDWPYDPLNSNYLQRLFNWHSIGVTQRFNMRNTITNKYCDKSDGPCKNTILDYDDTDDIAQINGIMVDDPTPIEWGIAQHLYPESYQMSGPMFALEDHLSQPGGSKILKSGFEQSVFWGENKKRVHSMTLRFKEHNSTRIYRLGSTLTIDHIYSRFGPEGIVGYDADHTRVFETDHHWNRVEFRHTRQASGRLSKNHRPQFIPNANFSEECGIEINTPGLYQGFKVSGFPVGICVKASNVILSGVHLANNDIGITGKGFIVVDSHIENNTTAGIQGSDFLTLNSVLNHNAIGLDVTSSAAATHVRSLFLDNNQQIRFLENLNSDFTTLYELNSLPEPSNIVIYQTGEGWHIKGTLDPQFNYKSPHVTAAIYRTNGQGELRSFETSQLLTWDTLPEGTSKWEDDVGFTTTWNDVDPLQFTITIPESDGEYALTTGDEIALVLYPGDWQAMNYTVSPTTPEAWTEYYSHITQAHLSTKSIAASQPVYRNLYPLDVTAAQQALNAIGDTSALMAGILGNNTGEATPPTGPGPLGTIPQGGGLGQGNGASFGDGSFQGTAGQFVPQGGSSGSGGGTTAPDDPSPPSVGDDAGGTPPDPTPSDPPASGTSEDNDSSSEDSPQLVVGGTVTPAPSADTNNNIVTDNTVEESTNPAITQDDDDDDGGMFTFFTGGNNSDDSDTSGGGGCTLLIQGGTR